MDRQSPDQPAADPLASAPAPAVDAPRVVLVVDDDDLARTVVARVLTSAGYGVVSASDGRRALEVLDEQSVDLVLMDVEMPLLSGFETVRRLRQRWPAARLPVIMLTGHSEHDMAATALEAGASDVLGKPCPRDLLVARVAERLPQR